MIRFKAVVLGCLLLVPLLGLAPSAAGSKTFSHHPDTGVPDDEVIVAVIDTGVDADHPEFDGYRGDGSTDPQIVAWWDFAKHGAPGPGKTWDAVIPVPYDSCVPMCHGTGTASLVGGQTVGASPGVHLAIAKVGNANGDLVNVREAVDWAVKTVGADVISLSLGTTIPVTGALSGLDEAMDEAEEAGVLAVAAAGNGLLNRGVRYPSETHSPSYAPTALAVGATSKSGDAVSRLTQGTFSNTDPDVTSWGVSVKMADDGGGYTWTSGTSFSTPLVAGWTSELIEIARANGQPDDPARMRQLVMWTAADHPAVPYAVEGYGYVGDGALTDIDTMTAAQGHAKAGTVPPVPTAHAAGTASHTLSVAQTSAEPVRVLVPRGAGSEGTIGHSNAAVRDADVHAISLTPGQVVDVTVSWDAPDGIDDIDAYLFRPGAGTAGVLSDDDIAAKSRSPTTPGLNTETITYTALTAGDHLLTVEGWLVEPFVETVTVTIEVDGQPVSGTFQGEHWVVGGLL